MFLRGMVQCIYLKTFLQVAQSMGSTQNELLDNKAARKR